MKSLLLFLLILIGHYSFCQSYHGKTTKNVNLREEPSKQSLILHKLNPDAQLFIFSTETIDNYYQVIDIESGIEGWVHSAYVDLGQEAESGGSYFNEMGYVGGYNSKAEIFNDTDRGLYVKIDNKNYTFVSQEKRVIELDPGWRQYFAWVPNAEPCSGKQNFVAGQGYNWTFYIVRETRSNGNGKSNGIDVEIKKRRRK